MSQQTIDCPAVDSTSHAAASEPERMRYDLIVRARREIRAGRYDTPAAMDRMLDLCMDRIVEDVRPD